MADPEVDARLIEAVEAADLNLVKQRLAEGANPNSRKTVTLNVTVDGEAHSDTQYMESALIIAIRDGQLEIVESLLKAGCDPNAPVSWNVSNAMPTWTAADWSGPARWFAHNEYPSALDFALANSYGKAFNEKGGKVVLNNPPSQESCSDVYRLKPNINGVKLLLKHGARVNDGTLSAAKKLSDKSFLKACQEDAEQRKSLEVEEENASGLETTETGGTMDPTRGPSVANAEATMRLIDAVEDNNVEAVKQALQDGADPNARKLVTLKVDLDNGERKTDTLPMESAMTLAIRNGATDDRAIEVVRALLEAGCDPNDSVEWKTSNYFDKWTIKEWEGKYRWLVTYKYASYLTLALTAIKGRPFSERGAHVVLDNPSNQDQRRDEFPLQPNIHIIRLLLQFGAKNEPAALQLARKLSDKIALELLENPPAPEVRTAVVGSTVPEELIAEVVRATGVDKLAPLPVTESAIENSVKEIAGERSIESPQMEADESAGNLTPEADVSTKGAAVRVLETPTLDQTHETERDRETVPVSEIVTQNLVTDPANAEDPNWETTAAPALVPEPISETENRDADNLEAPQGTSAGDIQRAQDESIVPAAVPPVGGSLTANARLVEAAEQTDVEALKNALADGADPNARKMVTLKVTLSDGQEVEDAQPMESALCLAIRNGATDPRAILLVQELLEAGADPNAIVEWKASNFFDKWTPKEWFGRFRWLTIYRFSSALEFALTSAKAKPFSEKGGVVVLDNPASVDARRDEFPLKPNMAIILLLLRHQGRITPAAFSAAKKSEDKALVRFLEEQKKAQDVAVKKGVPLPTPAAPVEVPRSLVDIKQEPLSAQQIPAEEPHNAAESVPQSDAPRDNGTASDDVAEPAIELSSPDVATETPPAEAAVEIPTEAAESAPEASTGTARDLGDVPSAVAEVPEETASSAVEE
ncbi:hypothetical protein M427DRAFT_39486, partial [Gonapodya prolifera JEL478]